MGSHMGMGVRMNENESCGKPKGRIRTKKRVRIKGEVGSYRSDWGNKG